MTLTPAISKLACQLAERQLDQIAGIQHDVDALFRRVEAATFRTPNLFGIDGISFIVSQKFKAADFNVCQHCLLPIARLRDYAGYASCLGHVYGWHHILASREDCDGVYHLRCADGWEEAAILAALRIPHPEAMTDVDIWRATGGYEYGGHSLSCAIACFELLRQGLIELVEGGKKWKLADAGTPVPESHLGEVGQPEAGDGRKLLPLSDFDCGGVKRISRQAQDNNHASKYREPPSLSQEVHERSVVSKEPRQAHTDGEAEQAYPNDSDAQGRSCAEASMLQMRRSRPVMLGLPSQRPQTQSALHISANQPGSRLGETSDGTPEVRSALCELPPQTTFHQITGSTPVPATSLDEESGLSAEATFGTQCEKSCSSTEGRAGMVVNEDQGYLRTTTKAEGGVTPLSEKL